MPQETVVTRCGNCGATLSPVAGQSVLTCAYCNERTYLGPRHEATPGAKVLAPQPEGHFSLHARLCGGPMGEPVGTGRRDDPAALRGRDVTLVAHAVWPRHAEASSTYGGGWSPSVTVGPPRVWPRSGDSRGAWAPGPAHSPVEWLELDYDNDQPIAAVRVYETHKPGSSFAVVDTTGDDEVLLWASPPRVQSGAAALEVTVSPPRVIRQVRVYVANGGWAEIDTVALLSASPLPAARQTPLKAPGGAGRAVLVAAGALVAVLALGVAVFIAWGSQGGGTRASETVTRPMATAEGTRWSVDQPTAEALLARGVVWAVAATGWSSEWSSGRNGGRQVAGPPDVYPALGDAAGAWAPQATDGGAEWITVQFGGPIQAAGVLWVETFNPGAVVRVDDVSDPAAPVVLWEGVGLAAHTAVVPTITFAQPRAVTAVRLVLDTRRVAGWNELDAVGLVPVL